MSSLLEEFASVVTALNDAKIDYAVCGGMAMAIHGFPRATVDIDILIQPDDLERVWRLAHDLGYKIEGKPLSLHGGDVEIRRISKIEARFKELITLDLLLVTEPLKDVWRDRERLLLGDTDVITVAKSGLIKLKTLAGRMLDLADIERMNNAG